MSDEPANIGIRIISGLEIICQRDITLGPIVAHEFRIGTGPHGNAIVDVKCPVCGDQSRVEFA